ncbi:MAG: ATP-dependent sacrificial sulfur transferase LarE [Spirochaetales bacterium]|nr:ATP-dependent sacrificial sulfur transferase LarE [Spirochaetales bacterium]
MMDLLAKEKKLYSYIQKWKKAIVAFSGGVDSSYLLYSSFKALGAENVLAVIASSETYPQHEKDEALAFIEKYGLNYQIIETDELGVINKHNNPTDRCYHCKKELFTDLSKIAEIKGYDVIFEGSNIDDLNDFRPGMKAVNELDVKSPLKAVEMTKKDIRALSKHHGLSTWDKPAFACLTSRFMYHTKIEAAVLNQIEQAENFLRQYQFRQYRVRYINDEAVVEVDPGEVKRAQELSDEIISRLREIGFAKVSIDPEGYRRGRMNQFIEKN